MRLIIEFDMAVIPRNTVINNAELFIYQLGATLGGDSPILAYRNGHKHPRMISRSSYDRCAKNQSTGTATA